MHSNIEKSYTITLTGQELLAIGESLLELPGKICVPIIANINKQIAAINNADTPKQKSKE